MKIFTSFILLFFFSVTQINTSVAQNNQKKNKQIEAIKFGYISARLNLNAEESQNFWPLYKNYQDEFNELLKQKKQNRIQNIANSNKVVDDDLDFDGKLLEVKKKYRVAFGKILPPEKLKALYQAERDFREELIKQLKNRPQDK